MIKFLHEECPELTGTVKAVHKFYLTGDGLIEKAFEQVKTGQGHIDALVNNAGITTPLDIPWRSM